MKNKMFYVFLLLAMFFAGVIYISVDFYSELKSTKRMQIVWARNNLFNLFLELKNIPSGHSEIEHFNEVLKYRHFSTFHLNDQYLCLFKNEKEKKSDNAHEHVYVIFIKKENPDLFYSFLINYKNMEVSYFKSEGIFFVLNELDNRVLADKTDNSRATLINYLFYLISNVDELRKISKEQTIIDLHGF